MVFRMTLSIVSRARDKQDSSDTWLEQETDGIVKPPGSTPTMRCLCGLTVCCWPSTGAFNQWLCVRSLKGCYIKGFGDDVRGFLLIACCGVASLRVLESGLTTRVRVFAIDNSIEISMSYSLFTVLLRGYPIRCCRSMKGGYLDRNDLRSRDKAEGNSPYLSPGSTTI